MIGCGACLMNEVKPTIAEQCLNHKLKSIEAVYDQHDYLDQRREALNKLASLLQPIINDETNVIPFIHTKTR